MLTCSVVHCFEKSKNDPNSTFHMVSSFQLSTEDLFLLLGIISECKKTLRSKSLDPDQTRPDLDLNCFQSLSVGDRSYQNYCRHYIVAGKVVGYLLNCNIKRHIFFFYSLPFMNK